MAKQRETKATPTEATAKTKSLECQLAGRLGLGVAVVRYVLSQATPDALQSLKEAFEQKADNLAELFDGLRPKPKPVNTPEAIDPE